MRRLGPATAIFASLVVATFAAFFVAQRLKNTPTALQEITADPLFSPNAGGDSGVGKRLARTSFIVRQADVYTVEVIDGDGDVVRTLARDVAVKRYRRIPSMTWDGRTDGGRMAPDGKYRYRVILRDEARSIISTKSTTLDTTPPAPRILSIGPESAAGPELLPNDAGKVTIRLRSPGRGARVLIFRTAPGRSRLVTSLRAAPGARTVSWNGRVAGARVAPGTYLAVARWRDKVGNLGTSVPLDADGMPAIAFGEQLPGHSGITVRYLEIEPPTAPVPAGQIVSMGVDARGGCFNWSLRPIGRPAIRRGRSCHTPFRLRVPDGSSRVYLLEARTRDRAATVPIAVQGRDTSPVLVVLPLMTWQGRNTVDDDGDGAADSLDRGVAVRPRRVLARGELPAGFLHAEGPLLAYLMNKGRRFDVTTDYELAHGRGPQLARHRGVILPGDVRWLSARSGLAMRRWVRGGGKLLSIGLDSLRRTVSFSPRGRLLRPTVASDSDIFGTRIGPLARRAAAITADVDRLQLFSGDVLGGTGLFAAPRGHEPTTALGPGATMAADAVTSDGKPVIVAARFGRGLVIRTAIRDFADSLSSNGNSGQLILRAWRLLARR